MKWKEKVIELMTTKNINQKDLSRLSGITETSISRYLNGNQRPRIDVLLNFARALEVNIEYLLEEERATQESSFTAIATAIARNGNNLTPEEQNKLISLILGKGKSGSN